MSAIEYKRKAEPPVVIVTADDGTVQEWPLAEFEADPAACVAATGNGISPPVPEEVDSVAAKTVLWELGLLDAADALVASQPRPVQLFWNRHTFRRDDPTLNALAKTAMGLTDAQLDDIFRAAASATAAG